MVQAGPTARKGKAPETTPFTPQFLGFNCHPGQGHTVGSKGRAIWSQVSDKNLGIRSQRALLWGHERGVGWIYRG